MSISGIQELINDLKKIHRYEIVKHLEACNEMLKIREKTSLAHVHAPLKILELKDPVIELLKDPEAWFETQIIKILISLLFLKNVF